MTTVRIQIDPQQTPEEEMRLVARVAAAVAETTGEETVAFELQSTEHVVVTGSVADRMHSSSRWSG
ncbi:MAG: hypothetical protein M3N17_06350 [Actinomycetota bacterium]|nr:hypothetical protein [Actinomycetota bacterium]